MSGPPTLHDLLDDAALLSFEHQVHLTGVLGEHSWRCDLAGERLEFVGADATFVCTDFHLLGTAAPEAGSWLWSWANPLGFPEPVTAVAKSVRYFGVQHRIAELSTAELPFTGLEGVAPEPGRVAGTLMEAAKIISGRWSGYDAQVGYGGARAAFLVEHPDFVLPQPDPDRLTQVLAQAETMVLTDRPRAVRSYLRRRGLTVELEPGGLTFTGDGVFGSVWFGADGRIDAFAANPK